MYLHKTPFFLKTLFPSLIWDKKKIKGLEKIIYLTFDDGPIPEITPFVLEQLEKYNAKATFFCVGENITKHPEIFNQLLSQGHTAANHTYNHLKGSLTSDAAYFENIEKCEDIIDQLAPGRSKKLFRPPYGRIKYKQLKYLSNHYNIVMWSILSGDFDTNLNPEKCLKKIIKYSSPGTIINFHDNIKAFNVLNYVLPRYLEYFSQEGYKFQAL